jgi:hypothetical protein
MRANRSKIFSLLGSSSSARRQSSKALLYSPAEIYAAARLLRYVADEGCASTAAKKKLARDQLWRHGSGHIPFVYSSMAFLYSFAL